MIQRFYSSLLNILFVIISDRKSLVTSWSRDKSRGTFLAHSEE